jgi:hypothetical protein
MDKTPISTLVEKLNESIELIKTILDSNPSDAVTAQTRLLLSKLTEMQSLVVSININELNIVQLNKKFKDELERLMQWEKAALGYELKTIENGYAVHVKSKSSVHQLKPEYFCPSCFKRKSLQLLEPITKWDGNYLYCPNCNLSLHLSGNSKP